MKKREEQSDFTTEYSTYYTLEKEGAIWGGYDATNLKCHYHTPEEIKMLMELAKKEPEWKLKKYNYYKPVRI